MTVLIGDAMMVWTLLQGDVREKLNEMPDKSIQCCVTSPPYWGLRDYGVSPSIWGGNPECEHEWETFVKPATSGSKKGSTLEGGKAILSATDTRQEIKSAFCQKCGAWLGCLGLEPTPELYVRNTIEVFHGVWRVLRDDGTLWLNLGDSYAGGGRAGNNSEYHKRHTMFGKTRHDHGVYGKPQPVPEGLKPKDLVGIPWRVAFALQADGWYLRSDIIWHKPNPMPESVTDRPTKAHEYIFLLTKNQKYFYDTEAVKEPAGENMIHPAGSAGAFGPEQSRRRKSGNKERKINASCRLNTHIGSSVPLEGNKRNKRSVWTVATQPYPGSHFATFPQKLIEPCILAGSRPGDTVLDPFAGSGTTLWVAEQHGRDSIGIELNPQYCEMIRKRMDNMQMNIFNIPEVT